jgi:hypothetical protein
VLFCCSGMLILATFGSSDNQKTKIRPRRLMLGKSYLFRQVLWAYTAIVILNMASCKKDQLASELTRARVNQQEELDALRICAQQLPVAQEFLRRFREAKTPLSRIRDPQYIAEAALWGRYIFRSSTRVLLKDS